MRHREPTRIRQCEQDVGHWDCVVREPIDQLHLVMYHSSSYHDTQCWAFGLQPNRNAKVPIYNDIVRQVDHATPSGV